MKLTTVLAVLPAALLATAAPSPDTALVPVQYINAIWSSGMFSTIGGPTGGDTVGHSDGFSLVDQDGNTIKDFGGAPGNHSPCYTGTRTFGITGGCFGGKVFRFQCRANIDGTPKTCAVLDSSNNVLMSAKGSEQQHYTGISTATNGQCGGAFPLGRNIHCDPNSEGFQIVD